MNPGDAVKACWTNTGWEADVVIIHLSPAGIEFRIVATTADFYKPGDVVFMNHAVPCVLTKRKDP